LTLIEMLVVMGICGVLAMLLIPMVIRARANARGIVCADNLKGIGQAYAIAMTQSNGYLPTAYYSFEGDSGTYAVTLKPAEGEWVSDLFRGGVSSALTCPADDKPADVTVTALSGKSTVVPASYAYNIALPLMFRNGTRVRQPLNTVTFYDGDLTGVVGDWSHSVGWAGNTIRNRHGNQANYLFLDGHVERSADFPDLAFEGGGQWVASAYDTRPRPEPPVAADDDEEAEEEPINFVIDDGTVIPNEDVTATILCIGAAFQYGEGGPRIPVKAYYKLNDGNKTLITDDVLGGETADLGELPAGAEIATVGKTTQYFRTERHSDDGSGHTWVFRNGDTVPSIAGFAGQRSIADFLSNYVDEDGRVTIGDSDCIFLFELSDQIDYQRYSHADFQDLVILVHFERKLRSVGGSININPNNNQDFEFTMKLPDDYTITRDDLHSDNPHQNHDGFHPNYLEYTGPAVEIRVKPKGNGNQNSMTVDGEPYPMLNKYLYTISSDNMTVHLYNDKRNPQGKAMGKWWIDISANGARIQCGKLGKGG
jgi:prepilin-type processing-associated H-X9-DG protein